MLFWETTHFAGIGLTMAAALSSAGFSTYFIRTRNNYVFISPERLRQVRKVGLAALWMLGIGFTLQLFYEINLLQIG